jgi:ribonuclease G
MFTAHEGWFAPRQGQDAHPAHLATRPHGNDPPTSQRKRALGVYDDCPYCKGRAKVKSVETMSVEIQRKLQEILKKRTRDESDFQLRIVVNSTVLERLRTQDEKHLIEMEKRYFGKLSFRADPAMHAEQFKIQNVTNNEDLASVS